MRRCRGQFGGEILRGARGGKIQVISRLGADPPGRPPLPFCQPPPSVSADAGPTTAAGDQGMGRSGTPQAPNSIRGSWVERSSGAVRTRRGHLQDTLFRRFLRPKTVSDFRPFHGPCNAPGLCLPASLPSLPSLPPCPPKLSFEWRDGPPACYHDPRPPIALCIALLLTRHMDTLLRLPAAKPCKLIRQPRACEGVARPCHLGSLMLMADMRQCVCLTPDEAVMLDGDDRIHVSTSPLLLFLSRRPGL